MRRTLAHQLQVCCHSLRWWLPVSSDSQNVDLSAHAMRTKTACPRGKDRMRWFPRPIKYTHVIMSGGKVLSPFCAICWATPLPLRCLPGWTSLAPPNWDIFSLYGWLHYAPSPPPGEPTDQVPGVGVSVESRPFSLSVGYYWWGEVMGSPHCAHMDTEDKSDCG